MLKEDTLILPPVIAYAVLLTIVYLTAAWNYVSTYIEIQGHYFTRDNITSEAMENFKICVSTFMPINYVEENPAIIFMLQILSMIGFSIFMILYYNIMHEMTDF